ncbi:MAG: ABC transporter ATP-binding protein/permease, partial [Vampirovibrio sp.]|nr:ABC transporter ATP-binding protein/permease [Vampirovibrio sp.]
MSATSSISMTPVQRLWDIIRQDKRDLIVLIVYTVFSGILSLAVPLGAQALVNTIAAGMFLQPLLVLSLLVFVGLLFAGGIQLLQFLLVEIIQQRIFARVALRLAAHVPRISISALKESYTPELVNRFFDTVVIQKTWAKLLMDGPSSILQILIGLILIGIYSPFLFVFDLTLVLGILGIGILGLGGLKSSIDESSHKYKVAYWLEELGRCHVSFKMNGLPSFLEDRLDDHVVAYINSRRQHFNVLIRQISGYYLLQALASTGVLAIGGYLVINQQLTLGQLVAAELVIIIIMAALDKLVNRIDAFYDLLTSLEKVGAVTDMSVERLGGEAPIDNPKGAEIVCRKVYFSYYPTQPVLEDLNLKLMPGERVSLVGLSGTGKTTLAYLLCGLHQPDQGLIMMNQTDVRDVDLNMLRRNQALVSGVNELFNGTVEENILLGRTYISRQQLQWALELVNLDEDLARL